MHRLLPLTLLLIATGAPAASAQVVDDFSDGDFTRSPAWTGTTDRWTVTEIDGDPMLRTDGLAEADTIYLATPSGVSYGTWAFDVRYVDVNLSNFNGARVFLIASTSDLTGALQGYFLQLGTNNSDEVRLYRLDGDPGSSSNRVLLGRSAGGILDGDAGRLSFEVTRTSAGAWSVQANGNEVLTAEDDTYTTGSFFGVWVKHSSSAPQAYAFDDVVVTGESGPADATPPRIADVRYEAEEPGFLLHFSEPLDLGTVAPGDFAISGGVGAPASAVTFEDDAARLLLGLGAPLASGTYAIDVSDVHDLAGNAIGDTTVSVDVVVDTEPPALTQVQALEARRLLVGFSEPVANGCEPARYALSGGLGPPAGVRCPDGEPAAAYELAPADDLVRGASYTLTVRNVEDEAGNRLKEATARFTFTGPPQAPQPGDLVINEILYAPIADRHDGLPDQPEYVELYNLTAHPLALGGLLLAEPPDEDGRLSATRLPENAPPLPPNGYAIVFDGDGDDSDPAAGLRRAFPSRDVTASDVVLLPVSSVTSRGLSNGGETIRLLRPDSTEIDVAPYDPAWHTATVLDLADTDGRSLERIDPRGPSGSAAGWGTSVDPEGGTPGARNSIMPAPGDPPSEAGLVFSRSPFDPAEGPLAIRYALEEPAALARVRIFDARGRLVRTLEEAVLVGGTGQLAWDGLDDEGRALRVGIYVVLFEAVSTGGGTAETFKEAVVLGRPLN